MPKYLCSYAYDTPCYYDVTIEAKSEAHAERIMKKALKAGKFDASMGDPCWENAPENKRVFVSGLADDSDEVDDLDNLK